MANPPKSDVPLRIERLPRAERDLTSIRAYIGQFAPPAAQRFAARLVEAAESLARHPDRGRPSGRYAPELVVIAPYLIRYRVKAGTVQIIRIKHGAQRPTSLAG